MRSSRIYFTKLRFHNNIHDLTNKNQYRRKQTQVVGQRQRHPPSSPSPPPPPPPRSQPQQQSQAVVELLSPLLRLFQFRQQLLLQLRRRVKSLLEYHNEQRPLRHYHYPYSRCCCTLTATTTATATSAITTMETAASTVTPTIVPTTTTTATAAAAVVMVPNSINSTTDETTASSTTTTTTTVAAAVVTSVAKRSPPNDDSNNNNNNGTSSKNNKKQRRSGSGYGGGKKKTKNQRKTAGAAITTARDATTPTTTNTDNNNNNNTDTNNSTNNKKDHFDTTATNNDTYASRIRTMNRGSYAHEPHYRKFMMLQQSHEHHKDDAKGNDVINAAAAAAVSSPPSATAITTGTTTEHWLHQYHSTLSSSSLSQPQQDHNPTNHHNHTTTATTTMSPIASIGSSDTNNNNNSNETTTTTTTTMVNEPEVAVENDTDNEMKRSKKKVTMFLGYLGTRYGGFQINEGVRSIQSELELALVSQNYIAPSNFGYPQKMHWSTSGRTDRGVHAAGQVISLKMELLPSELEILRTTVVDQLNAILPPDIRLLDICRTSRNFSAKLQRDHVRYRYYIPSICFYDNATTTNNNDSHTARSLKSLFETIVQSSPVATTATAAANNDPMTTTTDPSVSRHWQISTEEVRQLYDSIATYRTSAQQRDQLQSIVRQYMGTHSFHNFTKRCAYNEARSSRYIMDFTVEEPIIIKTTVPNETTSSSSISTKEYEMEWIPTTITGQSFLLNQIRKMVWLAIEITRGVVPEATLPRVLQRRPKPDTRRPRQQQNTDITTDTDSNNNNDNIEPPIRIGMAPAQGLFLDMSYYNHYNEKVLRTSKNQPNSTTIGILDWHVEDTIANQRWKEFRDTVIVQHIGQEEIQCGNFLQHLYMQEYRSFFYSNDDDDDDDNNDDDDEEEENETAEMD